MDLQDRTTGSRGSVTSGLAAMAVVLVAVVGWWLFSGNGPQGPSGNDARFAVPDVDASPSGDQPRSEPVQAAPGTLRIDSYVVRNEQRLELNYRSPSSCAGAPGTPRVLETSAAVTVTLTFDVDRRADRCSQETVRRTRSVLLDSPVSGRALLDGSVSPRVRVEPTTTTYQ